MEENQLSGELVSELDELKKEIRELKNSLEENHSENNIISQVYFFVPFGVAVSLYSASLINQAMTSPPPIWLGYMGLAVGLFGMLSPVLSAKKELETRKKK